jgi:hypothetical protein
MKPRAASTRAAVSDCPSVRYEGGPLRAVCTLMLHGRVLHTGAKQTDRVQTLSHGISTTTVALRHEVCRERALQMQTADVLERPRGQPDMSQVVNAANAQRTRAPPHLAAKPWTHHERTHATLRAAAPPKTPQSSAIGLSRAHDGSNLFRAIDLRTQRPGNELPNVLWPRIRELTADTRLCAMHHNVCGRENQAATTPCTADAQAEAHRRTPPPVLLHSDRKTDAPLRARA